MHDNAVSSFLSAVGLFVLIFYIYDVLKSPVILSYYYIKASLGFGPLDLLLKYGNWAAITGSSDGIGKAYARELARKGFNIVLISRNRSKLEKVAEEIESDFHVETKIIVADFSQQTACQHVEQELNQIPVRILMNNACQSKNLPETLESHTSTEIWHMINTNMGAVTQLSRYFINRLKQSKETGLIVNVSSGTNYTPIPKIALYAASKSFVSELTLALQEEARPYGIQVQLLKPFLVVTKINAYSPDVMGGGLFIPDPVTYARSAVDKLGKVDITTGYFWHAIQSAFNALCHWRLRLYSVVQLTDIMIFRTSGDLKWIFVALKLALLWALLVVLIALNFIL